MYWPVYRSTCVVTTLLGVMPLLGVTSHLQGLVIIPCIVTMPLALRAVLTTELLRVNSCLQRFSIVTPLQEKLKSGCGYICIT